MLMKQYWSMLIKVEARWWAQRGSSYYPWYFCAGLKTYTIRNFYFFKYSDLLFCSTIAFFPREFSFLDDMKSHPLTKAPKCPRPHEVKRLMGWRHTCNKFVDEQILWKSLISLFPPCVPNHEVLSSAWILILSSPIRW